MLKPNVRPSVEAQGTHSSQSQRGTRRSSPGRRSLHGLCFQASGSPPDVTLQSIGGSGAPEKGSYEKVFEKTGSDNDVEESSRFPYCFTEKKANIKYLVWLRLSVSVLEFSSLIQLIRIAQNALPLYKEKQPCSLRQIPIYKPRNWEMLRRIEKREETMENKYAIM